MADITRRIALEFGAEFGKGESVLTDHVNFDAADDGEHTRIVGTSPQNDDVLFSGNGHTVFGHNKRVCTCVAMCVRKVLPDFGVGNAASYCTA